MSFGGTVEAVAFACAFTSVAVLVGWASVVFAVVGVVEVP